MWVQEVSPRNKVASQAGGMLLQRLGEALAMANLVALR